MVERARSTWLARIAGLSYLIVIAGGLFAAGFARGSLIVPGDAAATANAIAASEPLWRWGLVVHLVYLPAAVAVNVFVCELVKPVDATLARLALAFGLLGVAIEAMSLVFLYVPLAMADEGGAIAGLDGGQAQALTYLAVQSFTTGFGISLLFFAGFCVLIGVLFVHSRLIPRAIGGLMILAGVCYFANSLAYFISSALSERLFPWILLPCLVAELSLALWLLVKAVNVAERRVIVRPSQVLVDSPPAWTP